MNTGTEVGQLKETDIPYAAKEVTELLGIGGSTIRKWCLALEEQNYSFIRTDQNKRMFTEKDLVVLKQFQLLVQNKHLSINTAAEVIASKYSTSQNEVFSNESETERSTELSLFSYEALIEQNKSLNKTIEIMQTDIEQLKTMNIELFNAFNEQSKYIKEQNEDIKKHINKYDSLLMQSIRESQEAKQLQLERQEEEKKKRKGIFGFFK
jgi:DNA-binding transcriptional MerR regulator